jgi:hypothetical protein
MRWEERQKKNFREEKKVFIFLFFLFYLSPSSLSVEEKDEISAVATEQI